MPETTMHMKTTIAALFLAITSTSYATIIPVDLGSPRAIHGDLFVTGINTLQGTSVAGQTLSLDYQFDSLVHLLPGPMPNSGFAVVIYAQTTMPVPGIHSVSSSSYAVGLDGFIGPTKLYTSFFSSDIAEIFFGLNYPRGNSLAPEYLTGIHFDLTLPDLPGVEITTLSMHLDAIGKTWAIQRTVPENTNSIALLAFSFVMLVFLKKKHCT